MSADGNPGRIRARVRADMNRYGGMRPSEVEQALHNARVEAASLRAEVERLMAERYMCATCSAWIGCTTGCEECSEFAEESCWNARVSAETERADVLQDELDEAREALRQHEGQK